MIFFDFKKKTYMIMQKLLFYYDIRWVLLIIIKLSHSLNTEVIIIAWNLLLIASSELIRTCIYFSFWIFIRTILLIMSAFRKKSLSSMWIIYSICSWLIWFSNNITSMINLLIRINTIYKIILFSNEIFVISMRFFCL